MSVFFYEPFYDLERIADSVFSEAQRNAGPVERKVNENAVKFLKPRFSHPRLTFLTDSLTFFIETEWTSTKIQRPISSPQLSSSLVLRKRASRSTFTTESSRFLLKPRNPRSTARTAMPFGNAAMASTPGLCTSRKVSRYAPSFDLNVVYADKDVAGRGYQGCDGPWYLDSHLPEVHSRPST